MKIRFALLLLTFIILFSSCEKPSSNNSDQSGEATVPAYSRKYSDDVKKFNLTPYKIDEIDLNNSIYIGNNRVACLYNKAKEDGSSDIAIKNQCYIINCENGEVINKVEDYGNIIQYGNGFAFIREGNNGLYGRYELNAYDNDGKLINTIVPYFRTLYNLNLKSNAALRVIEHILSDQYTVRSLRSGIFLRDEKNNTTELLFKSTDEERYTVCLAFDEKSFLFIKEKYDGEKLISTEYGLYNLSDRSTVYNKNEINWAMSRPFAAYGNKIISFNNPSVFQNNYVYYNEFSNGEFGVTKTLYLAPEFESIVDMAVSSDNTVLSLLSIKYDSKHNKILSFNLKLINFQSMETVYTKSVDISDKYNNDNFKLVLTYMDDGTIAVRLKGDKYKDNLLYVFGTR